VGFLKPTLPKFYLSIISLLPLAILLDFVLYVLFSTHFLLPTFKGFARTDLLGRFEWTVQEQIGSGVQLRSCPRERSWCYPDPLNTSDYFLLVLSFLALASVSYFLSSILMDFIDKLKPKGKRA
jgi:hypothetical protein